MSFVDSLPSIPAETRWRSSDLGSAEAVVVEVDLENLASAAAELIESDRDPLSITESDLSLHGAEDGVNELIRVLRDGRGIAIVRGFPVDDVAPAAIELTFWRIGLALGRPVSQSVMGELLGHVIDKTDVDPHARAYRRNEKLTPHTDPADYLAFLCLHPAADGGVNHFVSALELHEVLRTRHPELLERLYRGYRYSRFGEQADDEDPITPHRIPVFSQMNGLVSSRLVRQYIEVAAAEDPDIVLDETDRQALDLLDDLAADPDLALVFTLARGEAVFANNFTVYHARTGFTDPPGGPKRHLLRLWLEGKPGRHVVAETQIYPGSVGVPPQPGRLPSYATDVEII